LQNHSGISAARARALPIVGREFASSVLALRLNLGQGEQRVPVKAIRIVAGIEALQIIA